MEAWGCKLIVIRVHSNIVVTERIVRWFAHRPNKWQHLTNMTVSQFYIKLDSVERWLGESWNRNSSIISNCCVVIVSEQFILLRDVQSCYCKNEYLTFMCWYSMFVFSCMMLWYVIDERVGNLTMVVKDANDLVAVKSQLTLIVRGMYSNPPNHGGRIVSTVLNNPQLFEEW